MSARAEPKIPQVLIGEDAFVARLPICERNQNTFAYELLFRNSDGKSASAAPHSNAYFEIGLNGMVGSSTAFINVSRDFIMADHCRSLPNDRVVFEIPKTTVPDFEFMQRMTTLRAAGYRFALDNFQFEDEVWPLVPQCSFIKVNLKGIDAQTICSGMALLRELPSILIAENVEDREDYESCIDAGFQYFQGHFFCKPNSLPGGNAPVNRVATFRLVAKLQEPQISIKEIGAIVQQDLSLSYQLLRYINSANLGLSRTIESIDHAVRLVGVEQIRVMATLLMLGNFDDKPSELLTTSLVRARMCELLGKRLGHRGTDAFFSVGLFSVLDAFLDCPMEKALQLLPFNDNIRNALLSYDGPFGYVLKCVLAYERGDWETLASLNSNNTLGHIYLESLHWSDRLVERMPLPERALAS